jgi:hypothetical protein
MNTDFHGYPALRQCPRRLIRDKAALGVFGSCADAFLVDTVSAPI